MRLPNNSLIHLLSGGLPLADGWGFPPPPPLRPSSPLRDRLMFLQDVSGRSQLCRWYFGIIKAFPAVWRSLAGAHEGYRPSFRPQPCAHSPSMVLTPAASGLLSLGWKPGPEAASLTGVFSLDFGLKLGGETYDVVQERIGPDTYAVVWPEFMQLEASAIASGGDHQISFHPASFDLKAVAASLEEGVASFKDADAFPLFHALPRPEQKIAVAWLALAQLEDKQ